MSGPRSRYCGDRNLYINFRVPSIFALKYLKDIGKCGMIKTSIFYIWKDEMT